MLKINQDLCGEEERREYSRQREHHVQRPCGRKKPGPHERQDRRNRDAYVMRLEGWAGTDHADSQGL